MPDVHTHVRSQDDEFVLLCCDGVWDVMSNEQACEFVRGAWARGVHEPKEIARKIIEYCLLVGSSDNMTAMVCVLNAAALTRAADASEAARAAREAAAVAALEATPAPPQQNDVPLRELPLCAPACLYAKSLLDLNARAVGALDEAGLRRLFTEDAPCARIGEGFAKSTVDGELMLGLTEDDFFCELDLLGQDARFLVCCIDYWRRVP